jgi:hypothetical protein
MICGRFRFFDEISVAHRRPQPEHARVCPQVNVSHCNDRAECIAAATADEPWPILSEAA